MICTLVMIGWGQMFISGQGAVLYKACFYNCGSKPYSSYDRYYRVHPEYDCPVRLRLA